MKSDNESDKTEPAEDLCDPFTPTIITRNSEKKYYLVERLFNCWIDSMHESEPELLKCNSKSVLTNFRPLKNDYPAKYFVEICKIVGSPLPPKSLNYMLYVINMYAKELKLD